MNEKKIQSLDLRQPATSCAFGQNTETETETEDVNLTCRDVDDTYQSQQNEMEMG